MPAEDTGERTEQPTLRKRQEARERGQVAKSNDLNIAILLLGSFLVFLIWGRYMAQGVSNLVKDTLKACGTFEITFQNVVTLFTAGAFSVMSIIMPLVLVLGVLALLVNFLQVGPIWAANVLTPDIQRISPAKGFGRIFSTRGLVRTAIGVGKLGVIASVVYMVLYKYVSPGSSKHLFALSAGDPVACFVQAKSAVCELGIKCAVAMLVLAILDYCYQRWQYERDLRMTKKEVREETKRFEGDPKIKSRRRALQKQIVFQRNLHEVPNADVVVTNPTEYAVAIIYNPEKDGAPRVAAKGEGPFAERIRTVALEARVPVVQRAALARSLYRLVEVGAEIPRQLYEAVAEVLAYVWRISGKKGKGVA